MLPVWGGQSIVLDADRLYEAPEGEQRESFQRKFIIPWRKQLEFEQETRDYGASQDFFFFYLLRANNAGTDFLTAGEVKNASGLRFKK